VSPPLRYHSLVYLTTVHTSSPLEFPRKVFQQAFFARLMALRRSRRAALVALVLFGLSARLALPSSFLSSEISSAHQRLERRQTLLGLANPPRLGSS